MAEDPIKDALRMISYSFFCVTSKYGDDINAMVANWFTQVSFEPRLVVLGIQKTSYTYGLIEKGRVFVVNIINKSDAEIIKPFTKSRFKNPDKMKGVPLTYGLQTGCPILVGAAAYLECKVIAIHDDGGDHNIAVAEVIGAGVNKPGEVSETLLLPDLGWSYAG